jgi:hypothetical protein
LGVRKLKLKWNRTTDIIPEGCELKRFKMKAGHLIRWAINMELKSVDTYFTTGGGDTWVHHGYVGQHAIMSSFSKQSGWKLVDCPRCPL